MKFITYILVLLLSFLTKSLSSSAPKDREAIFSYHANIDTRNSACNHGLARWILSGKLRVQHFNGSLVLKLDDLKTSIFNGPREHITLAHEKEIPKDAEVLMEPFIIQKEDDGQISIIVQPGELLWSLNMKRGIASNFQIDIEKVKSTKINIKEKSVQGECDVTYKVLPPKGSDEIIHKIIDYKHCSNKPIKHVANVRPSPKPANFDSIKMKTIKSYTIRESNGVSEINNIHSISQLTYQGMSKSSTQQHIDQYQEFDLQEMKAIEESIDISKITVKKDIIFEYEKKDFEKEKEYSIDLKELKEQFYTNYDKFMKKMNTIPLENHNIAETDYVEEMFAALTGMTTENYKNLQEEFIKEDKIMELFIFWSLLPYVGTEQAMNYIVNYDFDQENTKLNEQVLWRSLVTFPTYITFPLDNKIESLEVLLRLNNSDNSPIGNIGKLSFATIVANGVEKKLLNKNLADKYVKLFHEHFLDNTEEYENRMTYLLGLVNMANILTVESMLEIITNATENSNLRVLAIVGLKKNLISNTNKLFDTMWPIVQNSTESVEMRIRALDLILSSNISEEQFNVILDTLSGKSTNLYGNTINLNDKHILHYFITTLRSFRNAEPFQSSLGSFADNALKNNSFPDYSRYWTTGNYRISYNDVEPNLGNSLQAQFIGDPKINSLDVLHFTYNHFAMSFDMGTYELYLKIRGLPKVVFMKKFMNLEPNVTSIPELLDLVKKFKFEIKDFENEVHVEIVVLIDGRVVYAIYDNLGIVRRLENLIEYETAIFFIDQPIHISYPLLDYKYIPSDLGTELTIMHDMEDIRIKTMFPKRDELEAKYRSSWYSQLWVESFNPIINSFIGTYKYFGDQKSIKINKKMSSPSIERKNDTINWVWDKVMGTVVLNAEALQKYCPKCEHFNEIKIKNKENKINDAEYLGIKFNYTVWKVEDDNPGALFQEFMSTHRSNTASLPLAKPLLIFFHYANFLYYFKQDLLRGNVRSIDSYDTPGYLTLDFDYDISMEGFNGMNPFKDVGLFFTMHLNNSEPDNESLIWNATFNSKYLPKCKEMDETKFKVLQTFNFEYYLQNSSTFIVNAKRELLLPDMKPNKFSFDQPQPGIGTVKIVFGTVEDPKNYLMFENFTNTNEQIRKVKEMTQYEECKKDAEGYEFIPPTVSCLTVFAAMSEYTRYKMDKVNLSNSQPVRYIDVSRLEKDQLQITMPTDNFGLILNQPYRIYDPTAMAYHDMDILVGSSRKCIITLKQIKTFKDQNIPFEEGAVFIECINKTCVRGVAVDKLSDKNMGFKLWSNENYVTATIVDGKQLTRLNGKPIDESVDLKNFEIHFMAANVIYIIDDQIHLYYNTEYMYIKAKTIYATETLGFCNM